MTMSETGASDKQQHYINAAMQPIELMQRLFSKEQFEGFLLGNILKYSLRCGLKAGQEQSDIVKRNQYAYWLGLAKMGKMIEPTKDVVPINFVYKGL